MKLFQYYNDISSTLKVVVVVIFMCNHQQQVTFAASATRRNNNNNTDFLYPDDLHIISRNVSSPRHDDYQEAIDTHHHHHHYPLHNHNRQHNVDDKIPPYHGGADRNRLWEMNDDDDEQIPLGYIAELNRHNVSDLLLNFVDGLDDDVDASSPTLHNRFGDDSSNNYNDRRASKPNDKYRYGRCELELQLVCVAENEKKRLFVPECVRIDRCGGCCKTELFSCQPISTEEVLIEVNELLYKGRDIKMKHIRKKMIPIERHTECACKCKNKPICNQLQEFNESLCRCECKNMEEMRKCHEQETMKRWNVDRCACECEHKHKQRCEILGDDMDQNCECVTKKKRAAYYDYL